jgi:hypothetical protein
VRAAQLARDATRASRPGTIHTVHIATSADKGMAPSDTEPAARR